MSSTLMTAPAAGWYRDPADTGAWRWWDGESWTGHLRAAEEFQTGPVQVAPAQTGPVQTGPVQTGPVQTGPVQTGPVQTAPTPTAPVHAAPAQTAPAQTAPTQGAPAPLAPTEPVAPPVAEPAAAAIPQPGETAPAPAARPGSASLTPAIPVTDQMYWHSAAAEKIEVPRITHTGSISVHRTPAPSYVRDWHDLGSPHTAGVWLLAVSPLLFYVVAVLIGIVDTVSGNVFGGFRFAVVAAVATGLNWVFAYADQRQLRERGYHPAAIWWMLLMPPLAYLIARGRVVRREGMRAWPPELLFVLTFLGVVAVNVLAVVGILALGTAA